MAAALENDFFHSYIFKEKQPVLVVFFATWCPKCNMMLPLVDEIENDFAKDLKVIRIDTEKYEKLTKECGIEIVPTFLLFSHGEALGMMSGILSRQVLKLKYCHTIWWKIVADGIRSSIAFLFLRFIDHRTFCTGSPILLLITV